jgi:hypothetical protein
MKWLIVLLLAGCSTTFEDDNKRVAQFPQIGWVVVDDIKSLCEGLVGRPVEGCGFRVKDSTKCVIFTGKITKEEYLGHEARHCFNGQFHN